jgi:hypothetical protein
MEYPCSMMADNEIAWFDNVKPALIGVYGFQRWKKK